LFVIILFYFLFFDIEFINSKDFLIKKEVEYKSLQNLKIGFQDIEKLLIKNNQELLTLSKLIESSKFNLKSKLSKRYPSIDLEINGLPQFLNGQVNNNKRLHL
jgi:tRNA uridine 5-carbamoylmethylation protein Kti12